MPNPIHWPKYYLEAALKYLTDRSQKPAIVVDNAILKDGVLATREKVSGDDCVICIAPGFVANLELDDYGLSFSAKFNGIYHYLSIPYEAISVIYAYQADAMVTDNGEQNMLTLPRVLLPPGAVRRNEAAANREQLNQTVLLNLEDQPDQALSDNKAPIVANFKR
jgi:stringent starvation protein B